jgi:hypothetical protein
MEPNGLSRMNAILADLDLSSLVGAEVEQNCLGMWQVQIRFNSGASISIEGDWVFSDEQGRVIDRNSDSIRQRPFQLHRLLQRVVVATEISPPLSLSLRFTWGYVLTLTVSNGGYESFSIEPLGIIL